MTTKWQVEIDPFCNAVLEEHWPDVQRFTDIKEVGKHNLESVDLIAGGFPCQDISQAGKGVGISGSRSGLWGEFARIIGELRPRYVLVENVPTLKARGLEVVLSDLAALGYDAEWDCIPALAVGAPHRRDRLWIVAYPARDAVLGEAAEEWAERQRAWASGESVTDLADSEGVAERTGLRPSIASAQWRGRSRDGSGTDDVADTDRQPSAERGQRSPSEEASPRRGDQRRGRDDVAEREESVRSTGEGSPVDNPERTRLEGHAWDGDDPEGRSLEDRPTPSTGLRSSEGPVANPDNVDELGAARRSYDWWLTEPDVGRVAHGVPNRVDRLTALGNAVVPQVAEVIGRRILAI